MDVWKSQEQGHWMCHFVSGTLSDIMNKTGMSGRSLHYVMSQTFSALFWLRADSRIKCPRNINRLKKKHDSWYDDLWKEQLGDRVKFVLSPDVILCGCWLGSKHQLTNSLVESKLTWLRPKGLRFEPEKCCCANALMKHSYAACRWKYLSIFYIFRPTWVLAWGTV